MLVHTDPSLSTVFGGLAARRGWAELPPLLITGRMGSGKRHYAHHFLRQLFCDQGYTPFQASEPHREACQCDCPTCRRLEAGECRDYTELTGREPIADLRHALLEVRSHQPTALPVRVLMLRRLDRCSEAALDALLGVVEEPPPHLRILATTRAVSHLPSTLVDRFHVVRHADMTPDQVRQLAHPEATAGTYPFRSLGQAEAAARHGFEARFREFFITSDFVGLERRVLGLMRAIEADEEQSAGDLIEFFAEWLFWRTTQYCTEHSAQVPGLQRVAPHLPGLFHLSLSTMSGAVHRYNPRAYITPTAQLYALVSSLHMLRRITVKT